MKLRPTAVPCSRKAPCSAPPLQACRRRPHERGEQKLVEIDGPGGVEVIQGLNDISPDLGRYIVEFAFGDVYNRPWLSRKQRQLVTIGALTAFGDTTRSACGLGFVYRQELRIRWCVR